MESHWQEDYYVDDQYGDEPEDSPESSPSDCKYPDIVVQLTGEDGNAFAIMGSVSKALRHAGVPKEERDQFFAEAMSGDYNDLLATCMKWVNVQ